MRIYSSSKRIAALPLFGIILLGLAACVQSGPRQMRSSSDPYAGDNIRSRQEDPLYPTASQTSTSTATDTTCPNAQAVYNSNLFNTSVTLCRPDQNKPSNFKIKLAVAPQKTFCFFPVFNASTITGQYAIISLGKAVCQNFSADDTYQDLYLPRNRTGRYNYSAANTNFQITGIIVVPQANAYYYYPCPSVQNSLCGTNYQYYYRINTSAENAFQLAQEYFESKNYDFSTGYFFLQKFFEANNYLYIQFQ